MSEQDERMAEGMRQIGQAIGTSSATLTEAWRHAQPAIAAAAWSIGKLGEGLADGYRLCAASLAEKPRPARLRRDDHAHPIGPILSVEERRRILRRVLEDREGRAA